MAQKGPWKSGLFDCMEDFTICCMSSICCLGPAYVAGLSAERQGESFMHAAIMELCIGWIPCVGAHNRKKLREKYNLEEAPCSDFCVHCCFPGCAACQEAREVFSREQKVVPVHAQAAPVVVMAPAVPVMQIVQPVPAIQMVQPGQQVVYVQQAAH